MSSLINAGRKQHIQLAFELLDKVKAGGDVKLTDLTMATSQLLNNYHNQVCIPDESWITEEETEVLLKLLRILADGIEEIERIKK